MSDDVLHLKVDAKGKLSLGTAERRWLRSQAGKFVTIRLVKKRRSLDQNAFWWAVPVRIIAEHCGYDPEQMHYALLGEWRGYIDGPSGEKVPRCASSSRLTTVEFTELIDWVQRWAVEQLDLQIPSPNEWQATDAD